MQAVRSLFHVASCVQAHYFSLLNSAVLRILSCQEKYRRVEGDFDAGRHVGGSEICLFIASQPTHL